MAQPAAPDSLTGLALDAIAQVRGGQPSTDDEPIQVRQVIQWLRREAANLLLEAVAKAERADQPLDDEWLVPLELPLGESTIAYPKWNLRYYRTRLPVMPLSMLGKPLVRHMAIGGEFGEPVEVVVDPDRLPVVARGWGRIPKPKPAALIQQQLVVVVLPEFLWGAHDLWMRLARPDPLLGVTANEPLTLSKAWQSEMLRRVMEGPMSVTVNGIPDRVNDAAPTPTGVTQNQPNR